MSEKVSNLSIVVHIDEELFDEEDIVFKKEISSTMKIGDFLKEIGDEYEKQMKENEVKVDDLSLVVDSEYLSNEMSFEESKVRNRAHVEVRNLPQSFKPKDGAPKSSFGDGLLNLDESAGLKREIEKDAPVNEKGGEVETIDPTALMDDEELGESSENEKKEDVAEGGNHEEGGDSESSSVCGDCCLL